MAQKKQQKPQDEGTKKNRYLVARIESVIGVEGVDEKEAVRVATTASGPGTFIVVEEEFAIPLKTSQRIEANPATEATAKLFAPVE